jgi:hypothetical protein
MTVPAQAVRDRAGTAHKNPSLELVTEVGHPTIVPSAPSPLEMALQLEENTRAALLTLSDFPDDPVAISTLWNANRETIEAEMTRHQISVANPACVQSMCAALASRARLFCVEYDSPTVWVARCAHLEARRAAFKRGR